MTNANHPRARVPRNRPVHVAGGDGPLAITLSCPQGMAEDQFVGALDAIWSLKDAADQLLGAVPALRVAIRIFWPEEVLPINRPTLFSPEFQHLRGCPTCAYLVRYRVRNQPAAGDVTALTGSPIPLAGAPSLVPLWAALEQVPLTRYGLGACGVFAGMHGGDADV